MIELKNVFKEYKTKAENVVALNNVSLQLPDKGFVFLLGKSGCGKSTLLNVVSGLDKVTSGEIIVNGEKLNNFSSKQLDDYRNRSVGFVFQEYNLIDEYSVYENIAISLSLRGDKNLQDKVAKALEMVGLAGYEKRKTSELSGGQKQRIAIARAIVAEVEILFADEPTGNLDSGSSKEIFDLLKELSKTHLVFTVTHDEENARAYGDRVITMSDGKVIADEVLNDTSKCVEDLSPNKSDDFSATPLKDNQNPLKIGGKKNNKGINLLSLTKLSFINAWKKKWRLMVTVVLFFFMLTLFGVSVAALRYDAVNVTLNTFYEQGVNEVKVGQTGIDGDRIRFTQKDIQDLQGKFPEQKFNYMYKSYNGPLLDIPELSVSAYSGSTITEINSGVIEQYGFDLCWGRLPKKYDEVCLTKYVCDEIIKNGLFINIKSYSDFGNRTFSSKKYKSIPFKVVGIVDTKTENFESKLQNILFDETGVNTVVMEELEGSYTASIMVSKEFLDKFYYNDNDARAEYSYYKYNPLFPPSMRPPELTTDTNITVYQESYIDVSKENFGNIVYMQGKTNIGYGEIVISRSLMVDKAREMFPDSIQILTDEQINQYLNSGVAKLGNVVLQSHTSVKTKAFKIVGYYQGDSRALIMNNDELIEIKDWYGVGHINTKLTGNKKIDSKLINEFLKPAYRIYSFCGLDVDAVNDLALTYQKFGLYATLAFGVFSVIMMANFIVTSINSNKKQIGILRALGMRASGIVYMFMLESLIAGMIAFLLATIAVFPVALLLSHLYVQYVVFVQALVITIVEILAMFGLSVAVCVLASIIPIIKKSRVQPVKLLKE